MSLDAVVVLTAAESGASRRAVDLCARAGLDVTVETDPARFDWTPRVLRAAALVVVSHDRAWAPQVVRDVGFDGPVLVFGRPSGRSTVEALHAGADIVVAHDISEEEGVAAVRALVRRSSTGTAVPVRYLKAADLTVDLQSRAVRSAAGAVPLTERELAVLITLMRAQGRALSTQAIVASVWGGGTRHGLNALRITVRRLREKLGDPAARPRYVSTVRNHGYRFEPPVLRVDDDVHEMTSGPRAGSWAALTDLALRMGQCEDEAEATRAFVEGMIDYGVCEAIAVHTLDGPVLRLIAERGHSARWRQSCSVVPARPGFASAQALDRFVELQVSARTTSQFRDTAQLCEHEQLTETLFLPFHMGRDLSGCVGVSQRARGGWTEDVLGLARTATAVYAGQLSAHRSPDRSRSA